MLFSDGRVWYCDCQREASLKTIGDSLVIKKQFAIALSIIITAVSFGLPGTARAQARASVENIRGNVQVLSASKDTQVEVKFHDKTKVKGYIVSVEPVSFTLKDPKDGR